jgi:hypothetical protein
MRAAFGQSNPNNTLTVLKYSATSAPAFCSRWFKTLRLPQAQVADSKRYNKAL